MSLSQKNIYIPQLVQLFGGTVKDENNWTFLTKFYSPPRLALSKSGLWIAFLG